MTRSIAVLASIVGAALLLAQFAAAHDESAQPATPDQAITASANGGYFATYGATRRIEFTANRDGLNNSKGQGSFFNTTTGLKTHFTIDCLRVEGNVATMSGIGGIEDAVSGEVRHLWLQVIDNGEGVNSQDKVSPLFTSFDPLSCEIDLFPGHMFDIDANNGNIQVR
jgi:hypothetical protein